MKRSFLLKLLKRLIVIECMMGRGGSARSLITAVFIKIQYMSRFSKSEFLLNHSASIAQLLARRVSDRYLAYSRFDSRARNVFLGEKRRLFSVGGQAVYPLRWPSLTKDLQTDPKKLVWLIDAEYLVGCSGFSLFPLIIFFIRF